jgi:hypothetical protein
MKVRAAIILDNLALSKWQLDALNEASDLLEVTTILNCKNTTTKKRPVKNFLYYLINAASLKNHLTRKTPYHITNENVIDFDSEFEGAWQRIPKDVVQKLKQDNISLVIKFGMNLLRINSHLEGLDILSFHHGDPSKYRGRPAGFYEILNHEKTSGVIVQKLSNKLDAGEILAFAQTKVIGHSYKKTALNLYSSSKHLLRKAVNNRTKGNIIPLSKSGKNYTLPSNHIAILFIITTLTSLIKKVYYGAFIEKKWLVAISKFTPDFHDHNLIDPSHLTNIPVDHKYTFYADPFFTNNKERILLEALDKKSGLGDILEVDRNDLAKQTVLLTGKHYSYPTTFIHKDKEYLLTEVASHSNQHYSPMEEIELEAPIKGIEDKRIVDATLFQHRNHWFLFFGENQDAHSVLHLYTATSIESEFVKHPNSPICMSPKASRMAGRIVSNDDRLYRLGQNNEGEYGESLTISEILELSETSYSEKETGTIKVDQYKGPHSMDIDQKRGSILIDYYQETFSIFAGARRFKALLSKK